MVLSWTDLRHMTHTSTIMMQKGTVTRSVPPTAMPIVNPRDKGAGATNNYNVVHNTLHNLNGSN